MLTNYILLAFRNIAKQRGYAIVNTLGLAIGLASYRCHRIDHIVNGRLRIVEGIDGQSREGPEARVNKLRKL